MENSVFQKLLFKLVKGSLVARTYPFIWIHSAYLRRESMFDLGGQRLTKQTHKDSTVIYLALSILTMYFYKIMNMYPKGRWPCV